MNSGSYIRLSQWAAQYGMHRMTAWRHYNAGTLPPELQPKKIGNIIYVLVHPETPPGRTVGYARVSSTERKPHLENQANRLWTHAGQNGMLLDDVVSEVELNAAKKVRKVKNMDPPLGFITTVSKFVARPRRLPQLRQLILPVA